MNMRPPPRAAQYELLDAVPNNVTEMRLPDFGCNLCQLFRWNKWQSLGLMKQFYRWTMIMFCFIYFILTIGLLFHGISGIFVALIFMPVLTVCTLAGLRILSETITAILIMPHQLYAITCELKRLNQQPMGFQAISPQSSPYLNSVNQQQHHQATNNSVPMAAVAPVVVVPSQNAFSY